MGLMIKYSFKNIIAKPFRLLLLVCCVVFASFTALLAADMRNNIESMLRGYVMDMIGKMDIMVYNTSSDIVEGLDEVASVKKVGISSTMQYEYDRDPSGYEYSFETPVQVMALSDPEVAYEMAFLPESYVLDDQSVVITQEYADYLGVSVGDTVHFETRDKVDIELNVVGITTVKNTIISGESAIVTNEIVKRINCSQKTDYEYWMIDVEDDAKIDEVADMLRSNDPGAMLEVVNEEMDNPEIESVYDLFYLLFLISFLLVIFVTVSIAEKIVNERMSMIGTLRSLGVTQGKTAFVLLIENILYAVIGSGIGMLIYEKVKPIVLSSMLTVNTEDGDPTKYFSATPVSVYLLVMAGAILVECAYPLYELTRAVKTPIRDIIFDNKDTEFKYRWSRLYAGIVLAVVSVVAGLLVKSFVTLAVSLACGVVALAFLIPFFIRIVSRGIAKVFRKVSFPVAQLAAENISRNRIIMGTAVLCVTSLTLSLLLGGVGEALAKDFETVKYNCDVLVCININDIEHNYRYIGRLDGVEEMDFIYSSLATATLGEDKPRTLTFISDTSHTILSELPAEGYALGENEIVISKEMASRLGLSVGDELKMVLYPDTDFPSERIFIIKDTASADKNGVFDFTSVIINSDLYDHFFSKSISRILIRTTEPEQVKERIENSSESNALSVETIDEYREDAAQSAKGLLGILRMVIGGSAALSLIGIAGNQSLGFITRKREIALLYSVALPRHKLKRLIFLESLFAMGISALVAAVSAPVLYRVLGYLFDVIADGEINILSNGGLEAVTIVMYLAVIFIVFMLTTLIPSGYLRKMRIAEELKYE